MSLDFVKINCGTLIRGWTGDVICLLSFHSVKIALT